MLLALISSACSNSVSPEDNYTILFKSINKDLFNSDLYITVSESQNKPQIIIDTDIKKITFTDEVGIEANIDGKDSILTSYAPSIYTWADTYKYTYTCKSKDEETIAFKMKEINNGREYFTVVVYLGKLGKLL